MNRQEKALVTHVFKGGRFDDHGVDIDVLPELIAYKTILVETAKELWRRNNPDRQRLPKNFEDSLTLKFYTVEESSAAIPLYRQVAGQGEMWRQRDELDEAVDLVAALTEAAEQDKPIPTEFPKNVLPLFEDYGKTLHPDEYLEQRIPERRTSAKYTTQVRERLTVIAGSAYEDVVDLIATVTMARVVRPRMGLTLDDGREIEAVFSPEDEDTITTALKQHSTAKVQVRGRGVFSESGQLQRIAEVKGITLLPGGELPFVPSARPIWEVFGEIMSDLPEEEQKRLPVDAAGQHDHYIYGTPKRQT